METADVIVIGGGVLGSAVAFYLAKQGAGRVIVLERHSVAQGNSSLAAGLLTRGRVQAHQIPMVIETYHAIEEIAEKTGEKPDLHRTGCLYVAVAPEFQQAIQDLAITLLLAGQQVSWLSLGETMHLVPWLTQDYNSALIFMPDDGYVDGYSLTCGYIRGGRALGVEVREMTPVISICRTGERVTGVKTSQGEFSAAITIDAAGVWAGMLARDIGIGLPMAPVRSHYWLTASQPAISPEQPFIIVPEARAYARPEGERLLFGFREAQSVGVDPRLLPETMAGYVFKQDPSGWESLLEGVPDLGKFFPLVEEVEITHYIKGLSNYTPDGNFVLGALPGLDGFLAATGCAGAGLAMSGGIGRLVADLALGQVPFVDPAPHRIDRFGEVDPFEPEFIRRCADARSRKITG